MMPEEIKAMLRGAHPEEDEVVRDFVASYESDCATCFGAISPGERAGYIGGDNEASCWDCCQQAKSL